MRKLLPVLFAALCSCFVFAANVLAECSATNQSTYNTCVSSSAATCLASETTCAATVLKTNNSAALVGAVVTKCCSKTKQRAQLVCASGQVAKLNLGRAVIPAFYTEFRQTSLAAIRELKALIRAKTLCSTGSN